MLTAPFERIVWEQEAGRLLIGGYDAFATLALSLASGYAGRGAGRNNPFAQRRKNVGPLPCGWYKVGAPTDLRGPLTFPLEPDPSNEMFGRSGFLIHGDSTDGDASRGCIVVARPARELIAALWRFNGGKLRLHVVHDL